MSAPQSAPRPRPDRRPPHPLIDHPRRMREMRVQALWMFAVVASLMGAATLSALISLMVRP